eukprot:CAMPEP_0195095988 /NCGR_PEP_ID=MMETSP0448-20130528/49841_1 /TAXON_ID=66468 /ORGANISM="Heterocapsa triquestra, Strain CCMP 448" /LENGTH=56 /DNA_ID=CAMNT_0040130305 /DNA_START=14 /DNA_END=181 /DNA_ORIENTATION=-
MVRELSTLALRAVLCNSRTVAHRPRFTSPAQVSDAGKKHALIGAVVSFCTSPEPSF